MRILCAGGGSGGHVTPIVAVLDELNRQSQSALEVQFVCDKAFAQQARSIITRATVPVKFTTINAGKFRRYKHFRLFDYITTPSVMIQNILDISNIILGTVQALWLVHRYRPDVVFAKGGFVCLPVGWAARLLRVPIVIHDSDARPGLTNRLLATFARSVATGYPLENYHYDKHKTVYTGVPIRSGFDAVSSSRQLEAKKSLGIEPSTMLVVGVGGGLGARSINEALVRSAASLQDLDVRIIIVAGSTHYEDTVKAADKYSRVEVLKFVSEGMQDLLSAADIVVTRASATSLQELAGLKKAVIAVPARQLADQHENARQLAKERAAIVLSDDDLDAGEMDSTLKSLLSDDNARKLLAGALHKFARPNASRDVARLIIEATEKKH